MGSIYSVGLAGESKFQPAVKRTKTGEVVTLRLEPFNKFDDQAIAVENSQGETIGYIPADSFIKRIIHLENKPVACHVERIGAGRSGICGVILQIELSAERPTPVYTADRPAPRKTQSRKPPKSATEKAAKSIAKSFLRSLFR